MASPCRSIKTFFYDGGNMKNKRWLAVLAIIAAGLSMGCIRVHATGGPNSGGARPRMAGNGNIVSQDRAAQGFAGVVFEGVGNVRVHPGEDYRVVVTTDSNIQDIVAVGVRGNTLHVGFRRNASPGPTALTVDVYLPDLQNVRLLGVGDITIGSGNAPSLGVSLMGVGNIYAQNFQAENVSINLMGVGDINAYATGTLSGRMLGVGSVLVRGDPAVSVTRLGAGRVRRL